ncbi:hypothetical protein [Methanohalophilus portucalensis]|uniref:Lipoprotein n=2 Tax=Methanohalophilus portucalensis TaxID=39664 RepID=A0A1L9C5K1_9EURY|nr:hypothetical protein [Methanohalophilus portucalensis]ATU08412.1 hypothetical protein BKM01_06265 [Methanohalophilus portucalensis]OJH49751.1 hypothetical protein MPF_0539 [Methanohalophilus portucalensis FDF-1]RNI13421.1 hypothetical protein EFE41_02255 [Methanohalophilus portucalensis FDF-1]SMH34084.1 hypothetical protein SAMN06264941_0804 [Methanohalophilus portucalensis FDF-1]
MNNWLKFVGIILLIFLTIGCTDSENTDDTIEEVTSVADKPPEYNRDLVRNYEIIETTDDPWGDAIRKQYRVIIPSNITKEELKSTLIQIIVDETSENNNIDAICIFAYDRKEDVNGAYTFGTVDWCPNGNWGDVTSEIAKTNDRTTYEYVFRIKDKVGNENIERPTDLEFEIDDYYSECSDAEWDKIDLSDPYAIVDEDVIYQKVADKYGITKEEAEDICIKVTIYKMK